MRSLTRYWLLLLLLGAALTGLARAGGGGGGGGHGGGGGSHSYSGGGYSSGWHGNGSSSVSGPVAGTVLLLLLGVAAFVAHHWQASNAASRARQLAAEQLLARLAQEDALWNLRRMRARVVEVYFKVQRAWTANNQALARDCLSERLYQKHQRQTDALAARGQRNVLEDIKLTELAIYSVADYLNDAQDTFVARIGGSMIDYTTTTAQAATARSSGRMPESFTEYWTFVRVANRWVLDSIAQTADHTPLMQGIAYSEQPATTQQNAPAASSQGGSIR